jgi:cytochrome P450
MATQAPERPPVPDHVPPELVHSIGLTEGPEFLAAPHAFMAGLHDRVPPVFYNVGEFSGSSWLLRKYDDCFHALRNSDIFTTAGATPFPRDPRNYFRMLPLESDPPDHRKYRAILDPMLSPKSVMEMEARIRKLANDLIDQFIDRGECDFGKEFGRPLPVGVFLDIMGMPREMMDTFVRWAMGLLHAQDRAVAAQTMGEVAAYLSKVIEEKKANPDDSAVSKIVHAEVEGAPMGERDVFGFTFFLFIAGLDTVFASLNNMFVWLAQNPDRRREIIDNPDNIGSVVEELLRVFSVTFSGRTLKQDYEIRGVKMKAGDKVTSILPAANYDPEVFENPTEVNFHRPRKPNLAFAGGVHSCMGAHLARLEVKICVQEFLRRIPDFRLQDDAKIEYWPGGVVGPKEVRLCW